MVLNIGGGGGNRTRVRKSSAVSSTCIAWSFNLIVDPPTGRMIHDDSLSFAIGHRTHLITSLSSMTDGSTTYKQAWATGRWFYGSARCGWQLLLTQRSLLQQSFHRLHLCLVESDLRECSFSACTSSFATHVEARSPPYLYPLIITQNS